jgi:hypothetical protein
MLTPSFGTNDNVTFNQTVTDIDAKYAINKNPLVTSSRPYAGYRVTYSKDPKSIDGRPMLSYITPSITANANETPIAQYVSHPSDFTYIVLPGTTLMAKCLFFTPTDLIISFKGSSSVQNFKHDLYAQFTAADLGALVESTGVKIQGTNNTVTGSFVKDLVKAWNVLMSALIEHVKTPNSRLFLSGHSLGGAYCSLFGLILF